MRLRWWVFLSISISVGSFFALFYILVNLWPDPYTLLARPQILFFTFMFTGLTSATVPVTAYLNYRFAKPDWFSRDKVRLLRQGVWVGLLGILLAYLQLMRVLNWGVALVLIGVFIFIEMFFLTRE